MDPLNDITDDIDERRFLLACAVVAIGCGVAAWLYLVGDHNSASGLRATALGLGVLALGEAAGGRSSLLAVAAPAFRRLSLYSLLLVASSAAGLLSGIWFLIEALLEATP